MSTESEPLEETFGSHTFRFEPPDLVCARFVGDVSAEEMAALGRVFRRASGKLYGILITKDLGAISSGAKKTIKDVPLADGIAVVGASRQMQFVISLLNKVHMMLNLGKNGPITFVATEEEARRWVEHLRTAPAK